MMARRLPITLLTLRNGLNFRDSCSVIVAIDIELHYGIRDCPFHVLLRDSCMSGQVSIAVTMNTYYENILHKNTSQCKILIVPEKEWPVET